MGAGSIVETIRENFHSTAFITLVDIDEIIISIAEKEFGIYQYNNIKIIQADAAEFVNTNSDCFDLIIIDLFLIDTIPETCTHSSFIQAVCNRLNKNGKLVFNTIRDTLQKQVFQDIVQELNKQGVGTRILKKLEGDNDMILGTKNIRLVADPDRISAFQ
jgi:spermidine synthase